MTGDWFVPCRTHHHRTRVAFVSGYLFGVLECQFEIVAMPTIEDRYRHVELLADMGLIRAGFVDTGSVNLGGTGADGLPVEPGYVYTNTFADVAHKMRVCRERRLGPSVAVFEPGFLRVVLAYHEAGALPAGNFSFSPALGFFNNPAAALISVACPFAGSILPTEPITTVSGSAPHCLL